jgi:hypothetical protein
MVPQGGEVYDIGQNASSEGGEDETVDDHVEMVNNVITAHHLEVTSFDKKSFMSYIKAYMKRVKAYLDANNPSRVAAFQKDIQDFVKDVLSRFDDFEFYTGLLTILFIIFFF